MILYKILLILCFFNTIIHCAKVNNDYYEYFTIATPDIGMPQKKDFWKYMHVSEIVLNYVNSNFKIFKKNSTDSENLSLGLFLFKVNLKKVISQYKKDLQDDAKEALEIFLNEAERLSDYLSDGEFDFFKLSKTWDGTKNFGEALSIYNQELQLKHFKSFKNYARNIRDFQSNVPTPELSDYCLASLLAAPKLESNGQQICIVPETCYESFRKGTNFGYFLTHRLLYLMFANLGRGCSIYDDDDALMQRFCSLMYEEASFIASNGLPGLTADLLYEQICLCTQLGYQQFLRRDWLDHITHFLTPKGCYSFNAGFGEHDLRIVGQPKRLTRDCDIHFTAVILGVLGSMIRYLVESVYEEQFGISQ